MDIWILIRHNSITRNSHIVNCFTSEERARDAREIATIKEVEKYGKSSVESCAYAIERSFIVS